MWKRTIRIPVNNQELEIEIWWDKSCIQAYLPSRPGVVGLGDTVATAIGTLMIKLSGESVALLSRENAADTLRTLAYSVDSGTHATLAGRTQR